MVVSAFVKIKKVIAKGGLIGKNMALVCKGTRVEGTHIFLMKPKFHFYDSLISNTPLDPHHSESFRLSPLHVETTIMIEIKADVHKWRAAISIDLNKWKFFVDPYLDETGFFPQRMAYMLLASFGLKNNRHELSFATLATMRNSYVRYIRSPHLHRDQGGKEGPESKS